MNYWIGLIFMLGLMTGHSASATPCFESKPTVIVLLGPPGAGKGTHAAPLSQQFGLPHISTGDLFRENIRSQTTLGTMAKKFMDQGNLVPDALVLDMLFARVALPDCKGGYILDGFPRTLAQAKAFDERLQGKSQLLVLNFNLSDELIVKRITGRIVCKLCNKPYHKVFDPPKNGLLCDHCGGDLYQRDDDKEEVIRKRLEVYREQTEPLIAYYASQNGALKEIDSQQEKSAVLQDVMQALPLSLSSH